MAVNILNYKLWLRKTQEQIWKIRTDRKEDIGKQEEDNCNEKADKGLTDVKNAHASGLGSMGIHEDALIKKDKEEDKKY